jgi:hypothetical protein
MTHIEIQLPDPFWWYTLIIPAIPEEKAGESQSETSLCRSTDPIWKVKQKQMGAMTHVVESSRSKHKTLSLIPSTAKKEKRKQV